MGALRADDPSATLQRVEFVGPQVGKELYENGALALLLVSLGIVGYLALRFEWRFAVAAIIANLHDVIIILGFFAFFQWEFSLPVLAAVLAVLGYSVNESVVIADRIRENFRKMRKATVEQVIDNAITSTISRTIITHGLHADDGAVDPVLRRRDAALLRARADDRHLFGIYSSVLVMAPLVRWLGVSREDLVKPESKRRPGGREDPSVGRAMRTSSAPGSRAVDRTSCIDVAARRSIQASWRSTRRSPVAASTAHWLYALLFADHLRRDRARRHAVPARRFAAVRRRHRRGDAPASTSTCWSRC